MFFLAAGKGSEPWVVSGREGCACQVEQTWVYPPGDVPLCHMRVVAVEAKKQKHHGVPDGKFLQSSQAVAACTEQREAGSLCRTPLCWLVVVNQPELCLGLHRVFKQELSLLGASRNQLCRGHAQEPLLWGSQRKGILPLLGHSTWPPPPPHVAWAGGKHVRKMETSVFLL